MYQEPGPAVKNSAPIENARRAASAHAHGVAARERDDAAFDCRGNRRVAEHGELRVPHMTTAELRRSRRNQTADASGRT